MRIITEVTRVLCGMLFGVMCCVPLAFAYPDLPVLAAAAAVGGLLVTALVAAGR